MNIPKLNNIRVFYRSEAFHYFLGIAGRYKRYYAIPIVAQLAQTVIALLFADATRRLFDKLPKISPHDLESIMLDLVLLTLLRIVVTYIDNYAQSLLNETVAYGMRRAVLDHVIRLQIGYHENTHSSANYNLLIDQVEVAKDSIVNSIQRLITLPISFCIALIYLLHVSPALGIIAVSIGPLQLLSNLVLAKRFMLATERKTGITKEVFFAMSESLHGIREVKINQLEELNDANMGRIQKKAIAYNLDVVNTRSIRSLCRDFPGHAGLLVGFVVAVTFISRGALQAGDLIAFMTLIDKISAPFVSMVEVINSLQQATSGTKDLFAVMETPAEDQYSGEDVPDGPLEIEFDNVNFGYVDGVDVLSGITFAAPAGSSLAVIGPSGSGKTTLIKLLFRFYAPRSGTIKMGGKSVEGYFLAGLRGKIGMVSQDIFLFDGTVAENISVGRKGATREEVINAAKLAEAYDFIQALPNGFDSYIGERGVLLSQGQKQRISIARVILRKASVIILDEPTSAFDVETEASFQRNIKQWADGCTKIVIAHRLSTIRDVDQVLFLEDGRVVECGPPARLLECESRFRAYCQLQELTGAGAV